MAFIIRKIKTKIHKLISLFSNKEKEEPTVCCSGCKHLFYWCDGSAGCDLEKEDICISNGFYLREERLNDWYSKQYI